MQEATSTFQFFVHDKRLREQIKSGVIAHFPQAVKPVIVTTDTVVNAANFLIVGISAVPSDPGIVAAEFVLRPGRKCGVIVWTEERVKWSRLSELHQKKPFQFIIARGGPREKFPKMFPGVTIARDITDFDPPFGQRVAEYISSQVCR